MENRRMEILWKFIEKHNLDVTHAADYAEPGYSCEGPGILFANWNEPGRWDAELREWVPEFSPGRSPIERVERVAEKLGYELEWSDEWANCDDCYRAIRTEPDSYGWRALFKWNEDGIVCKSCLMEDPESYVDEFLLNRTDNADTFGTDLAALGFEKLSEGENGFPPGQNDRPEKMAKAAKGRDFVFQIDNVRQFDTRFSLWVREIEEIEE